MYLKSFSENLEDFLNQELEALISFMKTPEDWLVNVNWCVDMYIKKSSEKKDLLNYLKIIQNYSKNYNKKRINYCSKKEIREFKQLRNTAHKLIVYIIIFKSLIDNPPSKEEINEFYKENKNFINKILNKLVSGAKKSVIYEQSKMLNLNMLEKEDNLFIKIHKNAGLL